MKVIPSLVFCLATVFSFAQNVQSVDTIKAPKDFENLYLRNLYSDSLVSSFVILVKDEVKKHRHLYHSEHVYVLEGEGEMLLGVETHKIKAGDLVFIPKNTIHGLKVTSKTPMKVLSIQAPFFDGSDRVVE